MDCVVKVNESEYDLFLRIDSNTRGNIFWFYFIIRNCTQGKKIKFNICNLTKTDTHYSKVNFSLLKPGSQPVYVLLSHQRVVARRND